MTMSPIRVFFGGVLGVGLFALLLALFGSIGLTVDKLGLWFPLLCLAACIAIGLHWARRR